MADNRVSISKLDKMIKWNKTDDVRSVQFEIGDGETVDVQVKHAISFSDMRDFVDIVADSVFVATEDGDEVYVPVQYYSAFDLCLVSYYTNLKSEMGFDRLYSLMYETDIISKLQGMVSPGQLYDIEKSIHRSIEFRKQMILSGERAKLNYIASQIDNVTPLLEQNAGLLAGVKQEDMTAAVQAMANMDEGKLAKEVLHSGGGNVVEMKQPKKAVTRKKKSEDVN